MRALVPVGRVLFALVFVISAIGHFSTGTVAAASAHGVPLASFLVPASGVLALIGAVSVMLGYRGRFGAFLLLVFLVPVTLFMHNFWAVADPQLAMMQRAHFLKNTALIGTCLLIMYYGSGPYSIDT